MTKQLEVILHESGDFCAELVELDDGQFAVRDASGVTRYATYEFEAARMLLAHVALKDRPKGRDGVVGRVLQAHARTKH